MALPPASSDLSGPTGGLPDRLRAGLAGVERFVHQPAIRRALPSILIVGMTLIALVIWLQLREEPRMALYPGMADGEKAAVLEALTTAGIEATLDPSTGQLEVPRADYHAARLALAAQGLPTSVPDGMDALNDLPMGASRSVELARLRQAQEAELARSITEIAAVSAARVHLALPERSAFLRDTQPPRASVFLTLASGRVLDPAQVEAIVNLVASSVPGMQRQDISVVDQMGRLLSRGSDDPAALLTDRQMQHRVEVENLYRDRIQALLIPIVGPDNLSVQVTLDMDFTRTEITEERVDPNGTALRSEQEQINETTEPGARGIPGAVSNNPPSEAQLTEQAPGTEGSANTAPAVSNRSTGATRNYEVSRTVETTQPAMARIARIDAAIVIRAPAVDPEAPEGTPAIPPELLADLERLAQTAIGFDEKRGDRVTVLAQSFAIAPEAEAASAWNLDWLPEATRQIALVAALAIVALGIVKPMLSRLSADPFARGAEASDADGGLVEVGEGDTLQLVQAKVDSRRAKLAEAALGSNATREEKYAVLRQLAVEDPGRIATVLQRMLKEDMA